MSRERSAAAHGSNVTPLPAPSRPWALVLSEYLDLAYLLRQAGVPALTARTAAEGLQCLENWTPSRVIVDRSMTGWEQVVGALARRTPRVPVETAEQVVDRLLAS